MVPMRSKLQKYLSYPSVTRMIYFRNKIEAKDQPGQNNHQSWGKNFHTYKFLNLCIGSDQSL